ncbi:uncharacterized protein (TIGR02646 family) [Vibrio crassostreae]|uniref:HNH endonuclease n=1 Tax=Vibrio crassostreae TaxID=246167 RepID=UPI00104B6BB6|nr:HNH endonuclease [Vibrio crassostreae]TCT34840.1 uncharacterized protein (TIGR02646 family) [Vibrio crassostreae]
MKKITPVSYSKDEYLSIDSFILDVKFDHNFWNDNTDKKKNHPDKYDKSLRKIKAKIKEHYKKEQSFTCVYCKNQIPISHNWIWWTEHIIPKSINDSLMFEPENLCVACIDCNRIKSDKPVHIDKDGTDFSRNSNHYKIIHPHFDKYSEHLEKVGFQYFPIKGSEKGKETIKICELTRFIGMELDNEPRDSLLIKLLDSSDENVAAQIIETYKTEYYK